MKSGEYRDYIGTSISMHVCMYVCMHGVTLEEHDGVTMTKNAEHKTPTAEMCQPG